MKILIITNGGIGDQIQYSSLIKNLKLKYPESEITIFCHSQLKFLHELNPYVSNVTCSIDESSFDLGFNFAINDILTDIFMSIKIKTRIGFIKGQNFIIATNSCASELMNIAKKKLESPITLSKWFCRIARIVWSKPEFYFNEFDVENCDIVLQYHTNIKEKNWSFEYCEKLIDYLNNKNILVTSHKKHRSELYMLGAVSFSGESKHLLDVANYVSKCKVLISPDTVTAHIGLALGIKTIVLDAGYDRGFCLPKDDNNLIRIKSDSMLNIKPETVYKAYENIGENNESFFD